MYIVFSLCVYAYGVYVWLSTNRSAVGNFHTIQCTASWNSDLTHETGL